MGEPHSQETADGRAAQKFRGLLEAAPDAMLLVDARGRIELVNRRVEELLGFSRQELIGRPVECLIPDRFRGSHVHHRDAYTRDAKVRPMGVGRELYVLTADGREVPAEISLSPVQTEDGILYCAAVRDATERKEAEARLQAALAAEQRAADARRDADRIKDEFLSTVSHELRTPLSVIAGFADLLLEGESLGEEPRYLLGRIAANAAEMSRLVEELLDYSRLQAGRIEVHPRACDLQAAVSESVDRVGPRLAGHELRLDVPDDVAVLADQHAVDRVLGNLLTNAAKFSPVGSPIDVTATIHATTARISVRDHGDGIPPEVLPRIFDLFFQAAGRDRRGLGIGLSIARRYAVLLGGQLDVESTLGEGTTFSLTLPRVAVAL